VSLCANDHEACIVGLRDSLVFEGETDIHEKDLFSFLIGPR